MDNNKISLREAITANYRGFRIIHKHCPGLFLSSLVCNLVGAITPYINIWFSAQIINEIAGRRDPDALWRLVLTALFVSVFLSLINHGLTRIKNNIHALFWYRKNRIYTEKMLDMDFCSLDESRTHELRSTIFQNEQWSGWGLGRLPGIFERFVSDLTNIAGAIALTVSLFTLQVPKDAGQFIILNHPIFVLGIAALMFAVTFIAPVITNRAERYWTDYAAEARMGNRYFGYFGFFAHNLWRGLDIRMYNQQDICCHYSAMDTGFGQDSKIGRAAMGPMGLLHALSAAISVVFTGLVYVFVCLKAWAGAFGVGSVTQYVASVTALSRGFSDIIMLIGLIKSNTPFLKTTYEFLDIPNDMYQGSLTTEKRADRNYEVEFKDVSFKYPGTDTYALRHVSMKFKVGERLAIVGMNGSGKTTFIKLLCRLYDPTEGEILLNGINIRKYRYDDYMSIFSIVFQDFKLLAFPLSENVAASKEYDKEKVMDCLQKAGFEESLSKMKKGIDTSLYTELDKEGFNVSGGEAQKIAIARALYKDSPFILLDEPTAALDPIAEAEIYSKFNEIAGDKTAIYISHRLSSCRFCDEIAVFHEGQVIQQGSHEELVADETGKYHELWYAQAQYYTENAMASV